MINKKIIRLLYNFFYYPYHIYRIVFNRYYFLPKKRITYSNDLLYTYHSAGFLNDPKFVKSYQAGKLADSKSLLTNYDIEWRVHVLCWAAHNALRLNGDFVECGVHHGVCSRAVIEYMGFEKIKNKFYLLDTFEGLSDKYSTTIEMQRNELMGYSDRENSFDIASQVFSDYSNVVLIKGIVPDTLVQVDSKRVAYLSIDMNCEKPEIDALEFFWEKLVDGAYVILDDYGYANSTNDQRLAHDEFALSKNRVILTLPTGQGLIIK